MDYKIIIYNEKIFTKDISKISRKDLEGIMKKIQFLKKDGTKNAQTKRLKNYPISDRRLRVGHYRVLFNIDTDTQQIVFFRMLHRSDLY